MTRCETGFTTGRGQIAGISCFTPDVRSKWIPGYIYIATRGVCVRARGFEKGEYRLSLFLHVRVLHRRTVADNNIA